LDSHGARAWWGSSPGRGETLARLRASTDAERMRVHAINGERWSLRKIARTSILIARVTADVLAGGI